MQSEDDSNKINWYVGCDPLWKSQTFAEDLTNWLSNNCSSQPLDSAHRLIYVKDESDNKQTLVWRLDVRDKLASHANVFTNIADEWFPTFLVHWPFDFMQAEGEQIRKKVLQDWNDEKSDLNFARRWLWLSHSEINTLLVWWKRGDETACQRAMNLVLLAFAPRCSSHRLRWGLDVLTKTWSCVESERPGWNHEFVVPPVFSFWGQAFLEVFEPQWKEEEIRVHACAQEYQLDKCHIYVWAEHESPTHHEQLEAARELSLWLDERHARDELPAATIARLRETLR